MHPFFDSYIFAAGFTVWMMQTKFWEKTKDCLPVLLQCRKSLLSVMVSKNVDYLKETAFSRSTATPTPALLLSLDLFVPFVVLVEHVRTIVFRTKTRSQACHTSPIFGLTVFWHHSSGAEPLRIGPQRPVHKNRSSVDFETQFSFFQLFAMLHFWLVAAAILGAGIAGISTDVPSHTLFSLYRMRIPRSHTLNIQPN